MNIIQLTEALKDFSDDQLIREMQQPSGNAPQYLVLSELERRKSARDRYKAQQQPEPTVAEEVVMGGMQQNSAIAEPRPQMNMRSGGLAAFGRDISREVTQDNVDPFLDEVEQMAQQKFNVDFSDSNQGLDMNKGPEPIFMGRPAIGFGGAQPQPFYSQPLQSAGKGGARVQPQNMFTSALRMNEGGIAKLNQGTRVTPELLEAIMQMESGGDPDVIGTSGEIGPYQIRPTTAISPGYNIPSLFPDLEKAVAEGQYGSFQEAYEANKDVVDSTLRDVGKSRGFASDYLTQSFSRYPDDEARAIAAYNVGINGAGELDDPSSFPYVQGVADRIPAQSAANPPFIPGISQAQASTGDEEGRPMSFLENLAVMPAALYDTVVGTPAAVLQNTYEYLTSDNPQYVGGQPAQSALFSGDSALAPVNMAEVGSIDEFSGIGRDVAGEAPLPTAEEQARQEDPFPAIQKEFDALPAAVTGVTPSDTTGETKTATGETKAETEEGTQLSALERLIQNQEKSVEAAREDAEFNKYLALAQMGAALASAKGPSFLGNVGEAVQAGLPTLAAAKTPLREAEQARDKIDAELAIAEIKAAQKEDLTEYQRASLANSIAGRADRIRDDINKIRSDVSMFGGDKAARDSAIADLENTLIQLETLQSNILSGLPLDTMIDQPTVRGGQIIDPLDKAKATQAARQQSN